MNNRNRFIPGVESLDERILPSISQIARPEIAQIAAEIRTLTDRIEIEHGDMQHESADTDVYEGIHFPEEPAYAVRENGASIHVIFAHLPEHGTLVVKTGKEEFTMEIEKDCSIDLPKGFVGSAELHIGHATFPIELSPSDEPHVLGIHEGDEHKHEGKGEHISEEEVQHILFEAAEYFHVIHEREEADEERLHMSKELAEELAHHLAAHSHAHGGHEEHAAHVEHEHKHHEHEEKREEEPTLSELEEETTLILREFREAVRHGNGAHEAERLRHQIEHELKHVRHRLHDVESPSQHGRATSPDERLHYNYLRNREAELIRMLRELPPANNHLEQAPAPIPAQPAAPAAPQQAPAGAMAEAA